MIVQAFLRWAETARVSDRAKAANALGRAYLNSGMAKQERQAAFMAMTYLLDDPSPLVRQALAESLADAMDAPRAVMVSLADDQPEIAAIVIPRSPVLSDNDLVDLAGRGSGATCELIASRPHVSRTVSAALVEIGEEPEVHVLLRNAGAEIARVTLKRIAERFGSHCEIRNLLLDRADLPSDARCHLLQLVSEALTSLDIVRATVGPRRLERVAREAGDAATVVIAGSVSQDEIPELVEHLRVSGRLTPAFLMHALCTGKVDFFVGAVISLSGCSDRRVRSIIATGRMHAVRALYEASGLPRNLSTIFVEATLLWRQAAHSDQSGSIAGRLLKAFRKPQAATTVSGDLMEMVEKLHFAEQRQAARSYASQAAADAA